MRKFALLAVMMMSLGMCSATAFAAGGWELGVTGGVLKGIGDFGDETKTGMGGGLFVDYIVNSQFSVGADLTVTSIPHHDDGEDAATTYPGTSGEISDKFTLTNIGVHGKYWFPMGESPLKTYVVAGLGNYSVKEKFEVTGLPTEEFSDSKIGGRGGLGAEYMVNPQFGIGAEGNFHFISTEGESTTMLSVLAMLTYHVPMK